jgi:hypothetical protein
MRFAEWISRDDAGDGRQEVRQCFCRSWPRSAS